MGTAYGATLGGASGPKEFGSNLASSAGFAALVTAVGGLCAAGQAFVDASPKALTGAELIKAARPGLLFGGVLAAGFLAASVTGNAIAHAQHGS
ncbi:MAG: hypothetical protein H7287_02610 [Thermoleophilia bacterium]|nr:hypothetical protein [Thermoleophilia bacterium]